MIKHLCSFSFARTTVLLFLTFVAINGRSEDSLFEVVAGLCEPKADEVYELGPARLDILQVISGGALVNLSPLIGYYPAQKIIYVKMDVSGLTDGSELKKGLFRHVGTYSYVTAAGCRKTIPAFVALCDAEIDAYMKMKEREKEKARIYAERCKAEAEKKELAEQPERMKYAEGILSSLDLNEKDYIRIDPELCGKLSVRIKHYAWQGLIKQQSDGQWLEMLNTIVDIMDGSEDYMHTYKVFPDKKRIDELVDWLLKKCSLSVVVECVNKNLSYSVYEENPLWVNVTNLDMRLRDEKSGRYLFVDYPLIPQTEGCFNKLRFGKKFYIVFNSGRNDREKIYSRRRMFKGNSPFGVESESSFNKISFYRYDEIRLFMSHYDKTSSIEKAFSACIDAFCKYRQHEITAKDYLRDVKNVIGESKWMSVVDSMFVRVDSKENCGDVVDEECADDVGFALSDELKNLKKDVKKFARDYKMLKPSLKSKTDLGMRLSVLTQAMTNANMRAVYKRCTSKDPNLLFDSLRTEWSNARKENKEMVYRKYLDLYFAELRQVAKTVGGAEIEELLKEVRKYRPQASVYNGKGFVFENNGKTQNKAQVQNKVQGKIKVTCAKCKGKGVIIIPPKQMMFGPTAARETKCPECYGKGFILKRVTVK